MIYPTLFFVFIVHLVFNLERIFYINEIYSLIGLAIYIYKNYLFRVSQDRVLLILNLLIVYLSLYVLISFLFIRDGSVYQFLRTTVKLYSIFSFFIGIEFYKYIKFKDIFLFNKKIPYFLGSATIFSGAVSSYALFSFLFFKKIYMKLTVVFFLIASIFFQESLTIYILLFGSLLVFLLIKVRGVLSKAMITLTAFTLVFLFIFLFYILNIVYFDFYAYGYEIIFPGYDVNSIWRIMLWAYMISHQFLENVFFGIGFGSKMFLIGSSPEFIYFYNENSALINDREYTLGLHNSFLYILIRFGIVGLFFVVLMYINIFYRFFKSYAHSKDNLDLAIFLSFVLISISASFNVVLESPLYASTYWIIAGMAFQSTKLKFHLK